jgi:hypothetical protein
MVLLTRTGASSGCSSSVAVAVTGAFKAGVGFNERPDPHVTHSRTLA